jgi:hypothetical protein
MFLIVVDKTKQKRPYLSQFISQIFYPKNYPQRLYLTKAVKGVRPSYPARLPAGVDMEIKM